MHISCTNVGILCMCIVNRHFQNISTPDTPEKTECLGKSSPGTYKVINGWPFKSGV